jgi:pimeloyl-ACP methyl ester carboxylesterase
LRAAAAGRAALEAHFASAGFDPEMFTPADHAALSGAWSWLAGVAGQGLESDQGGMVDDDLAYVTPWGCDPGQASGPILFVHGAQDRVVPSSHSRWLAAHRRSAELWLLPDEGHVSVLSSGVAVLDWLRDHTAQG